MNPEAYRYCRFVMKGELQCIAVEHPDFSALIALQGAQLLSFQPKQALPWIWLSEQAEFKQGVSVRGGIPVCWPWFGRVEDNPDAIKNMLSVSFDQDNTSVNSLPAHGLVRNQEWQLLHSKESDDQVELSLAISLSDSDLWQGKAHLQLDILMQKNALKLSLTTKAVSDRLAISQALHTYFPCSDITQVQLSGFEGASYYDALHGWQVKSQNKSVRFFSETDRVYIAADHKNKVFNQLQLSCPKQAFKIKTNTASAVVWNPWVDKSKRLGQFASDAWQAMYCVETANVMDDSLLLNAGEQATLVLEISAA